MLSWDDFRIVKAIADCGSLAEAAKALRINQSTVFESLARSKPSWTRACSNAAARR